MTGWQLDPPTIQTVVTAVEADRDRLSRAIRPTDMEAVQDGLSWGGPLLDPLRTAVVALTEIQGEDVMTIRNHVAAGILGLVTAATAYREGNDAMVEQAQQQMLSAADDGDFSWFIENGLTGDS